MGMLEENQRQAQQADQAITEALKESESTVSELTQITGFNEMRVRRSLARLQESGQVAKDGTSFFLCDVKAGDPQDNYYQIGNIPAQSCNTISFNDLVVVGAQGFKDGARIDRPTV